MDRPPQRRSGATPLPTRRTPSANAKQPVPNRRKDDPPPALASAWLLQHLQALVYTLGQLSRHPLSTLMTSLVLGIALALPAGLHVTLENITRLSASWDKGAQIALFLRQEVSDVQAGQLADEWRMLPGIASVQVLTRRAALQDFRQSSGFGEALDALGANPLPAVLIIDPVTNEQQPSSQTIENLLERLRSLPEVELAQFDRQWLQRVQAMLALGQRGVWLLGALLALAAWLIVGNTIRLLIHSRRDEIEIINLIGATRAFIRRPFLYSGVVYGLLAALLAWLLVATALWLFDEPVYRLASLYHSRFALSGLDWQSTLLLLGSGLLLGWFGALLAVHRHLDAIEPC